jgi:trans-aconitate 2-methyltransferase
MPTWDPKQYLQFGAERLRPAIDLLARIPVESPGSVCDLGCGPGTATALLAARWPKARVTGVDSSPAMLEKARGLYPGISWREDNLETWTPDQPADVLFSNAALHWIDRHESLLPRLAGFLSPEGVLAVQIPFNFEAPIHTSVDDTIRDGPFRERLEPCLHPWPVMEAARYYEILRSAAATLDIWETTYVHVLEGEDPVVEWLKGTALRPVLDRLSTAEGESFLDAYRQRIRTHYPPEKDGKTLLPFRRIFIVATR